MRYSAEAANRHLDPVPPGVHAPQFDDVRLIAEIQADEAAQVALENKLVVGIVIDLPPRPVTRIDCVVSVGSVPAEGEAPHVLGHAHPALHQHAAVGSKDRRAGVIRQCGLKAKTQQGEEGEGRIAPHRFLSPFNGGVAHDTPRFLGARTRRTQGLRRSECMIMIERR